MITLLLHEIGHSCTYFLLVIFLVKILGCEKYPVKNVLLGYLVTIGLDGDHLVDYFAFSSSFHFNLIEFLLGHYFYTSDKIYVLLHAWEWVLLLIIIYFILSPVLKEKYKFILFIVVGMAAHLIFDTLSYGFHWNAYFITTRILHNFDKTIFISTRS